MIETLYKTDRPEKGKSECYVLVLAPRPASNGSAYSFMEEHGRWDETLGRFLYQVTRIVIEDRMTREAALAMYDAAKQDLSGRGFVHSFAPHHFPKEPSTHRLFEFQAATA